MKTNPLNIRSSKDIFLGELKSTGQFKVFINRTYGVRAAIKIISNYHLKYGIDFTIRSIVTRWAPPSENNTFNYINFVSSHMFVDPDSVLGSKTLFLKLIHAMAIFESNINLTQKCMDDAWNMVFPNYASID